MAARAVAARGRFAMAVPGGSVASRLLPALPEVPIDWLRTDIFWCDERGVPPDHPDSNYGAAQAGWLSALGPDRARLHRMSGDAVDLDAAAEAYAAGLLATLGTPPILDLVLLGVGDDGHVASLFPGHPALRDTTRLVVAVEDAPKPPPRRLTLTLPAILAARFVCVAAFGAGKREVMGRVLDEAAGDLPAARVIREAQQVLILLDPEADPDQPR